MHRHKEEDGNESLEPTAASDNKEDDSSSAEMTQGTQMKSASNNKDNTQSENQDNGVEKTNSEEKEQDEFNISSDGSSQGGKGTSLNRRNVAKRGKKRSSEVISDSAPQREVPKRAARSVRRYGQEEPEALDSEDVDDPDFELSDHDDDPDFDPSGKKAGTGSDEEDFKPYKFGARGRGRGRATIGRGISILKGSSFGGRGTTVTITTTPTTTTEEVGGKKGPKDTSNRNSSSTTPTAVITTTGSQPRRRGRPPMYANTVSNNSSNATEVKERTLVAGPDGTEKIIPSSTRLTSAFKMSMRSPRYNQAVRLPEGPQLTPEQLQVVESQFKQSGDFVVAKKDVDTMDNPPIWRIDGKSLLQKYQAFEKDGKMLYRNISTYSGWTPQAKALYTPVKVNYVFQSRYDTIVELVGEKDATEIEKEKKKEVPWVVQKNQDFEIPEELLAQMPSFEIYLQTLISQALDNNFLVEIYDENDDYFVERVKVIDDLTEVRKKKLLELVKWDEKFQHSLDTWPCVNVMISNTSEMCQACKEEKATKLSQFYGQPYHHMTLRSREPLPEESENKNFETCEHCSMVSQMYSKVCHQKYDYYSQCKSTVTNIRVTHPAKDTTTILRDLLANDHWITGLFRSMCTMWIKVDRYEEAQAENKSAPLKT
ncbi:uncharacterized protein LOC143026594 isoform X2 [Oratosquilla oratoria]|uniref:uncharacterized protein LOC143026594 isoform X2 n=1 Tax=Oratosquilla oratoria TaxID=337810 RepID=UPI003F7773FB